MFSSRKLPRSDFFAILFSLGGVTVLAWVYLFRMAGAMAPGMAAMGVRPWDAGHFLMMFLMWAVMMVGMMLPSVLPSVLIYQMIARKSAAEAMPAAPTACFVAGYLAMWVLFSLLATFLQWGLDRAALLSPAMVAKSPALGAGLLMAAGAYQWLPFKNRCLQHCRSPVHYLADHWHSGAVGAVRMGLSHGAYCIGCCWVLMGLLFAGGVMNLLWIAAITLFVLSEKLLPWGVVGGRALGLLMIAAGGFVLYNGA